MNWWHRSRIDWDSLLLLAIAVGAILLALGLAALVR